MRPGSQEPVIERVQPPVGEAGLEGLARLLVDTVESGGVVSFLAPLSLERAGAWWREVFATAHHNAVFLVARDSGGIAGTVQLHPCWAPNQPHRAEVTKLLVHPRCRRRGLGGRLMAAIEEAAHAAGYTLLTLDTRRGDAAERLYRKTGWVEVGVIPRFGLDPDGRTPHDAVVFYKDLA